MATSRTSLLEQKQIQWAKEREEMSRLIRDYTPHKSCSLVPPSIRMYSNGTRVSLTEMNGKQHPRYASTISLRSLASDASGTCTSNFTNLQDQLEQKSASRRRSPSLPPIYKHEHRYRSEDQHSYHRQSKLFHGSSHDTLDKLPLQRCSRTSGAAPEEREGETSGYASDNLDGPGQQQKHHFELPCHVNCNSLDAALGEKNWQNPYHSDENSLPSSKRLASLRAGEFNRQRWGSVWGQETSKDLPPPSWLERGLSRLDHSSQVLVINHDSASSPDSSTTGSLGSDTNKTYLRGQNLPIDANILQERELKRQKALELQNAIKQQLEEREKKRKEEKEKKLKEERDEEERIRRERNLEKQRFEEEQRRQLEKEMAKLKKSKAMEEVLEAAERQAKEEKRQRRRRNVSPNNDFSRSTLLQPINKNTKETLNRQEFDATSDTDQNPSEGEETIRLPVSQDVAIVLSGRIEDPEALGKSPLKLVNLVVSPSAGPRIESDLSSNGSLGVFLNGLGTPLILQTTRMSPSRIGSCRLLTPSKYRIPSGCDCSTQTDCEGEITSDFMEKSQEIRIKEAKERKDITNNNRRDVEKSTNAGPPTDESLIKTLGRNKSQARTTLESRPRWNANRPGTRYRTQSEKDPHYQRRMRMRRRQVETSDEGSSDFRRSPSPSRRKYGITKTKSRSSAKRKAKLDNYDADLSMDSLNSLVPLHTDKNGRINIEMREKAIIREQNAIGGLWCREEILSHLNTLRNGLIMKKKEWDLHECPVSPITELC